MYSVRAISPSSGSRSEKRHLPVHAKPLQAVSMSWRNSKRDPIYVNCCRCKVGFLSQSAVYLPKCERKYIMCVDCNWNQKSKTHIKSVIFSEVPDFIPANFVQRNSVCRNPVPSGRCAVVNHNYGSNQGVFMSECPGFLPQSGLKSMMRVDCKWNQRQKVHIIKRVMFSEIIDFIPAHFQRSTVYKPSASPREDGRCAAVNCRYSSRQVKCEICQRYFHEGCINLPKSDLRFFRCQDCQRPIDTGRRRPASSFSQANQGRNTRYHTRTQSFEYETRVKGRWSINF